MSKLPQDMWDIKSSQAASKVARDNRELCDSVPLLKQLIHSYLTFLMLITGKLSEWIITDHWLQKYDRIPDNNTFQHMFRN